MNSELLADKLNEHKVTPEVNLGQVEVRTAPEERDNHDNHFTGFVDAHPAGADCAGYVPFVYVAGRGPFSTVPIGAYFHPGENFWTAID